jgi:tricorn protease
LLRVRPKGKEETRDVIVKPVSMQEEYDLRYREWEYSRRQKVEEASGGKIGYVHLRAMGSGDINQWVEEYSPVFTREGLIIDVRHNQGGNIDSWILGKLLRKVWMYWQSRTGKPYWNMQQAFRGYLVVLCDEWTSSDGEAFSEGFRRLGLGKVIGTRTWGGEVWLSAGNWLADRGIATTGETGVYGPERSWLIEGHGVDPDIVVDNLPHATFTGKDAQLDAAISHLEKLIREKPIPVPVAPDYPDKSLHPAPAAELSPGTRKQ